MSIKVATLIFPRTFGQTLLGLKTVRMGAGCWTACGGHLEEGEALAECALRELKGESGLIGNPDALTKVAIIDSRNPVHGRRLIHTYVVTDFTGQLLQSSDEFSKFAWYDIDQLPWPDMRESDRFWSPAALRGHPVMVDLWYNDREIIQTFKVASAQSLPDDYQPTD